MKLHLSNKTLLLIIAFGGGLVNGSFATYFYTKRKFERITQEEIDEVKAYYKEKQERLELASEDETHTTIIVEGESLPVETDIVVITQDGAKQLANTIITNGYAQKSSIDYDKLKDDVMAKALAKRDDITKNEESAYKGPLVITEWEYMEDHPEYDKLTLTWFDADDTLCDQNEQPIPDISNTIGDDALCEFKPDVYTVYVRNEKTATDYEIVREKGSYSEVVLGIVEDKVRVRKMREFDDG